MLTNPPVVLRCDLAAEAVDLVVVPLHGHDLGIVDEGADDLPRLEIRGDEDDPLESGLGGLGGDRVGEVPRRGAGDRIEPELLRLREGDGDDAVLEREGGMAVGVVLDVDLSQAELRARLCAATRG